MARRADPDYTEFGIKIHKLRLTLKVQKRASSATPVQQNHHQAVIADAQTRQRRGRSIGDQRVRQQVQQQPASERRPQSRGRHRGRPRTGSSVSSSGASIADSLRLLDLDANAGSRRPVVQDNGNIPSNSGTRVANWEFQGFYSPPIRTSTPSSGYASTAPSTSVSRTSSFSCDPLNSHAPGNALAHAQRLASAGDDSAYSEVYSTIEELSELQDPFEDEPQEDKMATLKAKGHNLRQSQANKSKSMSSLQQHPKTISNAGKTRFSADNLDKQTLYRHEKTRSSADILDEDQPPPLFPRHQKSHSNVSEGTLRPHQQQPRRKVHIDYSRQMSRSDESLGRCKSPRPPPLPPRGCKSRPPARPPYPSSLVRVVLDIAEPLNH